MIEKALLFAGCALSAALAGCAGAPAQAPPPPVAQAAPAAPAAPVETAANDKPAPKHKTCQTDYQVGSHLSTNTVCLTDDEEDQLHEQQEQQRDVMRQGAMGGPSGN